MDLRSILCDSPRKRRSGRQRRTLEGSEALLLQFNQSDFFFIIFLVLLTVLLTFIVAPTAEEKTIEGRVYREHNDRQLIRLPLIASLIPLTLLLLYRHLTLNHGVQASTPRFSSFWRRWWF